MKISECAYCGKMALIENEACDDCARAMNSTSESVHHQPSYPAEMYSNSQQNYKSQNAGHKYEPQPKNTQVRCWRCREMNVWEQTKICLKCGCALKPYKSEEAISLKGDSILSSPGIRSMLVVILLITAGISGIMYLSKSSNDTKTVSPLNQLNPNMPIAKMSEEVELPSDSWYKPSIWNFYRKTPTVEEILQKNNEATSKFLKTKGFETLSFSGKLSVVNAGCANDKCAEIERKRIESDPMYSKSYERTNLNAFKVGLADYFENFDYQSLGTIESAIKSPGKLFRKVMVRPPGQTKTTEKTEAYDGVTGWRKTVVTEQGQTLENSVKDLMEIDLYELKNSASAGWQGSYSSKSFSFVEMKKVKGKVQFVLSKNDTGKSEYIYFDALSGLATQIKNDDMSCFLSAYIDYDGYKMPSSFYYRTINADGSAIILKVENIVWKINEPIEDTIFGKPY